MDIIEQRKCELQNGHIYIVNEGAKMNIEVGIWKNKPHIGEIVSQ